MPRDLRPALVPILRTIADLTARVGEFERRIEQLAANAIPRPRGYGGYDGWAPSRL